MKKNFKYYIAIWLIVFCVFNVLMFLFYANTKGIDSIDGSSWLAYALINVSLIGQLICAWIALNQKTLRKVFLNISIVQVSFLGIIISAIVGILLMFVIKVPSWIASVICLVILAINTISVLTAKATADIIGAKDEALRQQQSFIRSITAEAQQLMNEQTDEVLKREISKVYEAFRYSDPMSSKDLKDIESNIRVAFNDLASDPAKEKADKVLVLISRRNTLCKGNK